MMEKRDFKQKVYQEVGNLAKALSNAGRMEIVDLLANGAKNVEEIANQTAMSVANASQHLQTLKKERLVIPHRRGNQIYYSLASEEVYGVFASLRQLTLHQSPFLRQTLDGYREGKGFDEPLSREEIPHEDVLFLDVRPREEYQKGHLKNSLSLPLEELNDRLNELPKNKLMIAYCRGMFCTMADEAVKILLQKGFRAKKMEEGYMDVHLEQLEN